MITIKTYNINSEEFDITLDIQGSGKICIERR